MSIIDKIKGIPEDFKGLAQNIKNEVKREVQIELLTETVSVALSRLATLDADNAVKYQDMVKQLNP